MMLTILFVQLLIVWVWLLNTEELIVVYQIKIRSFQTFLAHFRWIGRQIDEAVIYTKQMLHNLAIGVRDSILWPFFVLLISLINKACTFSFFIFNFISWELLFILSIRNECLINQIRIRIFSWTFERWVPYKPRLEENLLFKTLL